MSYFLSKFEAGARCPWLATRAKGIWRRRIASYRDFRVPPRSLTLKERLAAREPEIKAGKETV